MRSITLTYEKPQISINGHVFDVRRSDTGILQDMMGLDARFSGKDANDPEVLLEYHQAKQQYIDTILGSGSMQTIWESIDGVEAGPEPGIAFVNRLMSQIVQLSTAAYNEAVSAKYDD